MTKGWEGCPSDQMRFYLNTLQWISGNADALAGAPLKLAEVKSTKRSTAWKMLRGVIGPRTTYSAGVSSPDDYVKKAKELGLDFIVFLEDFAALKSGGFDKLKRTAAASRPRLSWPCPAFLTRTPTATTSTSSATPS